MAFIVNESYFVFYCGKGNLIGITLEYTSERNHCISSGGIAIEMITLITLITLITCWHYK